MKQALVLFLSATAIFLNACHKDDSTPTPPVTKTGKLLISTTYSGVFQPVTLKYDAQGRLVQVEDDEDRDTYTFKGDSVFIKEFRKTENRYVYDFKGKMDAKGRIISGKASASYVINSPYVATFAFEYDAQGYMVKQITDRSDQYDYVYEYTHQNGDMVKSRVYLNGALQYGADYEYYTDMANKTGLEGNKFYGYQNGLTGTPSQHLMKKATGINDKGESGWTAGYTYQLDADGYPASAKGTSSSFGDYQIFYSYQ